MELVGLSLQSCPGHGSHRSPAAGGSTVRYADADCGEAIPLPSGHALLVYSISTVRSCASRGASLSLSVGFNLNVLGNSCSHMHL